MPPRSQATERGTESTQSGPSALSQPCIGGSARATCWQQRCLCRLECNCSFGKYNLLASLRELLGGSLGEAKPVW